MLQAGPQLWLRPGATWAFEDALSVDSVRRLAALGIGVAITLYPVNAAARRPRRSGPWSALPKLDNWSQSGLDAHPSGVVGAREQHAHAVRREVLVYCTAAALPVAVVVDDQDPA